MSTTVDKETGEITETPDEPETEPETEDETPEGATPDGEPGPSDDEAGEEEVHLEQDAALETPVSQKEIDAKTNKLEKASASYLKRVADILGDDLADFVPSPLSTPFLFGFVFDPAMAPLDDSVLNATRALIGEPVPPPLVAIPEAQMCTKCEGWGQVLTGSKVYGKAQITCPICKGAGWLGEAANVTPAQAAAGITPDAIYANGGETLTDDLDPWGTPKGHPDFGVMPQYRPEGWESGLVAYKRGEPAPVGG